jgi:hypothetical protein
MMSLGTGIRDKKAEQLRTHSTTCQELFTTVEQHRQGSCLLETCSVVRETNNKQIPESSIK